MKGLTKVVPGGKEVLKDIWLSFLPGAKIGVIGPNGAGKSTLMKIMAGLDDEFEGEAWPAQGVTVGHLPQEPPLDEDRTVRENVLAGLGEVATLVDQYNELSAKLAEPLDDDEMQRVLDRMAEAQDKIDAADAWDLDRTIDIAMDALRVPNPDAGVQHLSGGERRRVALLPAPAQQARHPAARRADQPPRRRDRRVAAAPPQRLRRDGRGHHPRPLLPRRGRRVDPRTRQPARARRSTATTPAGSSRSRSGCASRPRRPTTATSSSPTSSSGSARRPRAAVRRARRASRPTSRCSTRSQGEAESPGRSADHDPRTASRLGGVVVEAKDVAKGFEDKLLYEDLTFSLPPGGIVGIIGPNGAGKTTLFRMLVGEQEPDDGVDPRRRHRPAVLRRPVAGGPRPGRQSVFEEITGGVDWGPARRPGDERPRLLRLVRVQGRRPAEEASARALAVNATASTSRSCSRPAATCCCSTSRPTTSTSTPCAGSRRRCSSSRAARSSSATTAGSSTASPRTSSRSRATPRSAGTRATTRPTRRTSSAARARRPSTRPASSTSRSRVADR